MCCYFQLVSLDGIPKFPIVVVAVDDDNDALEPNDANDGSLPKKWKFVLLGAEGMFLKFI